MDFAHKKCFHDINLSYEYVHCAYNVFYMVSSGDTTVNNVEIM